MIISGSKVKTYFHTPTPQGVTHLGVTHLGVKINTVKWISLHYFALKWVQSKIKRPRVNKSSDKKYFRVQAKVFHPKVMESVGNEMLVYDDRVIA